MRESGWKRFAKRLSAAYGIPQPLPKKDSTAEIDWALDYIRRVYKERR